MSYETLSQNEDRMSLIHELHQKNSEKFVHVFRVFSIQFLTMLKYSLHSYNTPDLYDADMSYELTVPDLNKDGKLCDIDFRKISMHLSIVNSVTKRTIRIFLNPFALDHVVFCGYSHYNPVRNKRTSKFCIKNFHIDQSMKNSLTPGLLFGVGEFLIGEREDLDPKAPTTRIH